VPVKPLTANPAEPAEPFPLVAVTLEVPPDAPFRLVWLVPPEPPDALPRFGPELTPPSPPVAVNVVPNDDD